MFSMGRRMTFSLMNFMSHPYCPAIRRTATTGSGPRSFQARPPIGWLLTDQGEQLANVVGFADPRPSWGPRPRALSIGPRIGDRIGCASSLRPPTPCNFEVDTLSGGGGKSAEKQRRQGPNGCRATP